MEWQKFETAIGSPLYVCEMPGAQSVSSAVLLKAGTRDEIWPKEAGIAHALEHMMFHGAGVFSDSQAISEEVEKTGGWLNAWTSKEATCYINGVPPEFLEGALFVLSEQISRPHILEKKIPTEMANIIEEVKMYNDEPMSRAEIIFEKAIFHGHSLEKDTLGTVEALKSFSRKDFFQFIHKFYHPENIVFVVVGAVKSQHVIHLINHNFQSKHFDFSDYLFDQVFPPGSRASEKTKRSSDVAEIKNISEAVERKDIEQANIRFGWLIPPASFNEAIVFKVFREMLNGGMSFPLFQEVREKRGLCYAVQAFVDQLSDSGHFSIYVGTDACKVSEAIDVSLRVIQNTAPRNDLLRMVKVMMSGRIKMQFESTMGALNRALGDIARGNEPESLDSILRKINSVTIEEVENAVNAYLTEDKMTTAMVLPRK